MGDRGWGMVGGSGTRLTVYRVFASQYLIDVYFIEVVGIYFVFQRTLCTVAAVLQQSVCRSLLSKGVVGKSTIADFVIRCFTHHHVQWQQYCSKVCVDLFSAKVLWGRALSPIL